MSTRCQIKFVSGDDEVLIYQHSDGYPKGEYGVLQNLSDFFKWDRRGDDIEYVPANFIVFGKLGYYVDNDKDISVAKIMEDSPIQLCYGICQPDGIHGDIAYFYTVDIKNRSIQVQTPELEVIEVYDIEYNGELVKRGCNENT